MATVAVTMRFDLTDAQWAVSEPLLPVPRRSGRPSKWTKRQLIQYIYESGFTSYRIGYASVISYCPRGTRLGCQR